MAFNDHKASQLLKKFLFLSYDKYLKKAFLFSKSNHPRGHKQLCQSRNDNTRGASYLYKLTLVLEISLLDDDCDTLRTHLQLQNLV